LGEGVEAADLTISSRWLGVMLDMAKHLSPRMKLALKSHDELMVDARPQVRHWKVMELIRLASVRYCTWADAQCALSVSPELQTFVGRAETPIHARCSGALPYPIVDQINRATLIVPELRPGPYWAAMTELDEQIGQTRVDSVVRN
jgi:hypothetical protein